MGKLINQIITKIFFNEETVIFGFLLGIIFLVIGTGYNFLISKWILPSRAAVASLTQKYHMNTYLTEFQIPANSKVIGKSINDLNFFYT